MAEGLGAASLWSGAYLLVCAFHASAHHVCSQAISKCTFRTSGFKSGKGGAWTIYPLSPNGQRMDGLRCDDIVRGEIKISPPHNLHHISIIQKPTPKSSVGPRQNFVRELGSAELPIPKGKPRSHPGLPADAEENEPGAGPPRGLKPTAPGRARVGFQNLVKVRLGPNFP